jgi:AcrR family transcriptional regulator
MMIDDDWYSSIIIQLATMTASPRRSPEDVRNDILVVAWDLFRQLGVHTTVADVAERLGMSSANVYRFFPSKQALTDAVCASQLVALTDAVRAVAARPGSAGERARAMILALHAAMREQMLHEARVHEIVNVALNERWPAIDAFMADCAELLAAVIAEGQARGEFATGDARTLALHTLFACMAVFHPALIARRTKLDPSPEDAVDFVLRALANRDSDVQPATPGGAFAR